MFLFN